MDEITKFLGSLWGLPGVVLTFVLCIAAGYGLKKVRRYPNDAIPLTIMLVGAAVNCLIADPLSPPMTMRLWLGKNMIIGFIAGASAWMSHKFILKKVESLFGSNEDAAAPKADGNNVKPKDT